MVPSADEHPQPKPKLTPNDYATNVFRAMLKAIPYLGGSLDQFLYGSMQELRMRGILSTVEEIAEILRKRQILPSTLENEEFANLLESVAPALSRSTSEFRRQCFRNVLLNASQTPPGDPGWEEAKLASKLLEAIDPPGLAILAALARNTPDPLIFLRVRENESTEKIAGMPEEVQSYNWAVIEEWARRLSDMRIITIQTTRNKHLLHLKELGVLLIRWAKSKDS